MESITLPEIESLNRMLNRYTERFGDEFDEDEDRVILWKRISDAYWKVRPEPVTVDPEKLKAITDEEMEGIHDLIESLMSIFESGVSFEEKLDFENLCAFYKRLVPAWEAPKFLKVQLRY